MVGEAQPSDGYGCDQVQHQQIEEPMTRYDGAAQLQAKSNEQWAQKKMIGLQDLNLPQNTGAQSLGDQMDGLNNMLADMSRISMTGPAEGQEAPADAQVDVDDIDVGLTDQVNMLEQDLGVVQQFAGLGQVVQEPPEVKEAVQVAVAAPVASAPAASGNTEWKKAKIPKKKRFGAKNQKNQADAAAKPKDGQPELAQPKQKPEAIQTKNLEPLKIDIADKHEMNRQMYLQAKNKRAGEAQSPSSPVPLPLFDCIYCVGIHEHLVLQTCKEKSLTQQYGCVRGSEAEQDKRMHGMIRDDGLGSDAADFYQKMEKLDQLFVVNLMANKQEIRSLERLAGDMNGKAAEDATGKKRGPTGRLSISSSQHQPNDMDDSPAPFLSSSQALHELHRLTFQLEKQNYNPMGAQVQRFNDAIAKIQK